MPRDALHIKIVSIDAKIPTRRLATSVEYEISALDATLIPGRGKGQVRTGLVITPPSGMFIRLENKADYAFRHQVSVVSRNCNPSLHQELVVDIFNHGDQAVMVKKGAKFATFVVIPRFEFNLPFVCELPDNVQVTPIVEDTDGTLQVVTPTYSESEEM